MFWIQLALFSKEESAMRAQFRLSDLIPTELSVLSVQDAADVIVCQSARNVDPLSASNIHPPVGQVRVMWFFGFSFENGS
jgi:hypothetical protein